MYYYCQYYLSLHIIAAKAMGKILNTKAVTGVVSRRGFCLDDYIVRIIGGPANVGGIMFHG